MTPADVFLAAFIGCLLALAVVAVAGYQIARWRFKLTMGRFTAQAPPDHIALCECGHQQTIPFLVSGPEGTARSRAFLASVGWHPLPGGMACPACAIKHHPSDRVA